MKIKLTKEDWFYERQLKRITGMTGQKDEANALGYFGTLRTKKIELPPMEIQQALEIMSNGSCITDK